MRQNLKNARLANGMTQQGVADHIGVTVAYYQRIESGQQTGKCKTWDALEDLFGIHQRSLREDSSAFPVYERQ